MIENFDGFTREEIFAIIYNRVHGEETVGPPVDARTDHPLWHWLADCYIETQPDERKVVDLALCDLLDKFGSWHQDARREFSVLLQLVGGDRVLEKMSQLLGEMEGNVQCRDAFASLLKCHFSRAIFFTEEVLVRYLAFLGDDYGALILAGMVGLGPLVVSRHLPALCASEEALNWCSMYLRDIEKLWGRATMSDVMQRCYAALSPAAQKEFAEYVTAAE